MILEKSSSTSKIIVITNHYNNTIDSIKSRCIIIEKNKYDKYLYFKIMFDQHKIFYNDYLFKDVNTLTSDDYLFNKYEVNDYQDILEENYKQLKNV